MRLTVCRCAEKVSFTSLVKRSKAKPIDRERKAVKTAQFKIKGVMRKFLAGAAANIAVQVDHALAMRQKMSGDEKAAIEAIVASLNFTDWQTLTGQVGPIIKTLLIDSGQVALDQIDAATATALDLVNERAVEYAKQRSAELVTNISESTRGMLRSDIADAMESGDRNTDLAATLADNYAFSPERAMMIARTEAAYADVQGNLDAYQISGVVESKEWITGAGCCDLCDELDGDVIPLDDTFSTEDGPISGPPYHPNCRCDILPITKDDADIEALNA